jgi:hypothetical protein
MGCPLTRPTFSALRLQTVNTLSVGRFSPKYDMPKSRQRTYSKHIGFCVGLNAKLVVAVFISRDGRAVTTSKRCFDGGPRSEKKRWQNASKFLFSKKTSRQLAALSLGRRFCSAKGLRRL